MNVVSSYVAAFSAILNVEKNEENASWTEIQTLLLTLKQQLSCAICKQILGNAMHVPNSSCGHIICEKCVNSLVDSTPESCDTCRSRNNFFIPNKEIDTLIECFVKMCEYFANTDAYKRFSSNGQRDVMFDGLPHFNECDFVNNSSGENCHDFAERNGHSATNGGTITEKNITNESDSEKIHATSGNFLSLKRNKNFVVIDGKKVVIKQETVEKPKLVGTYNRQVKPKPNGCKCGLATQAPGKLTCCGQRCPCYVNGKACLSCKCRGCRNPQNRRLQACRTDDKSQPIASLPLAASHSLISISKSNSNHTTDEEGSDIDIDN